MGWTVGAEQPHLSFLSPIIKLSVYMLSPELTATHTPNLKLPVQQK